MTRSIRCAMAALVVALISIGPARAQQTISLVPADAPRWDAGGAVAWASRNQPRASGTSPEENWINAGSLSGSVGYHWTSHLTLEADVGTSSTARFYTYELVVPPDRTTPVYRSSEHGVKTTTGAGAVSYQFFENRWVHPFVVTGIEVSRERDRLESILPPIFTPGGRTDLPVTSTEFKTTNVVRPLAGGSFKFYVDERAFIKSDLRFTFDSRGPATSSWRVGIGFEF